MSSPYQPAPDQHDTAAYARPAPAPQPGPGQAGSQVGSQFGAAGWYLPGEPVGRSNPEADYWAGKYRRQRRWTRVLAAGATGAVLVAVGLGFAALQSTSSDAVATAGQTQPDGISPDAATPDTTPDSTAPDGTSPDPTTPDGSAPQGTTPDGSIPDGSAPEGAAPDAQSPGSGSVPMDSLPLPDSLRSLASSLGITDLGQLVQLGVSMGLISEEQAADLLAAVQGGSALGDLLDGGQGAGQGGGQGAEQDGGQGAGQDT